MATVTTAAGVGTGDFGDLAADLNSLRAPGGQTTDIQKGAVLGALAFGMPVPYVSRHLGISRSAIMRIVKNWRENKTLDNKPRSGRPRKLTEDDKNILLEAIERNPSLSPPALVEATGLQVSASTVRRFVRDLRDKSRPYHRAPKAASAGAPSSASTAASPAVRRSAKKNQPADVEAVDEMQSMRTAPLPPMLPPADAAAESGPVPALPQEPQVMNIFQPLPVSEAHSHQDMNIFQPLPVPGANPQQAMNVFQSLPVAGADPQQPAMQA